MASGDPVLSCSRLPQSVQNIKEPMADMVANKQTIMIVCLETSWREVTKSNIREKKKLYAAVGLKKHV
jgi:hypothetical protein